MIVLNVNRMIFPFITCSHEIDFLASIQRLNKKGKEVYPWVRSNLMPHELRRELREFNYPENPNKVLSSYKLDKNCYGLYDIDFSKIFIVPHNNLEEIEFSILDILVHSFSSGISFLELRYAVKSQSERDALTVNYFLSELKSDVEFRAVTSTWNPELKTREESNKVIKVSQFMKNILLDYNTVYNIDMDKELKSYSTKPVLFSYYLLKEDNKEIAKHLGLNMKESYKISPDGITKTSMFDNSTWYYSLNSAVNISFVSNDQKTTEFFRTTFVDKISNLYFFLFLNALHQRFFLRLCQYKIKSFDYEASNFTTVKRLVDELSGYSASINKAWIKFFFDRPATIDHVNLFYETLRETFDVPNQMSSTQNDLEKIAEYADTKYKLFNEHNKLLSDKKKSRFDLITFFVAAIISFVSIYDTFLKMIENFGVDLSIPIHILLAALFMVTCFIVPTVINFYFNIKKMKQISEEISRLETLICQNQQETYF